MKKLLIILFFFPVLSFAQFRQAEITITGDAAYSIVQTKDKGYAMAGSTSDGFYFVKIDSNGVLQWTKTVGGGNYNEGYSMVQCKDGGYVMTGYTSVYGSGGMDVYVVKLDSLGNLKWTRTIGGPDDDWGNSIIQTRDGGYAITGGTKSFGGGVPGLADIWVIKLDSSGNKQWTKTVEGPWGTNDEGWSIIQARDGGYAVAGSTFNINGADAPYAFKLDSVGNLKWAGVIGKSTDNGIAASIIQTSNGGFAVTGFTSSYGDGSADVYVVTLDSLGNLKWTKTIGGTNEDIGLSIIQTQDKEFVVAGYTESFGTNTVNEYIIKLDSIGNLKWTKVFGEPEYNYTYSLIQTKDGGYATVANGNSGTLFVKLDSSGNSCLSIVSGGIIGSGGVITSGGSITNSDSGRMGSGGSIGSGGAVTVICKSTSVPEIMNSENIHIYPVPSIGEVNVSFTGNGYKKANIYDEFGRKVYGQALSSDESDKEVQMNLSYLSNGVYILQVFKNDEVLTKKIIIQK